MAFSEEQLQKFHRDGYLIIPDFLSRETTDKLRSKVSTMLNEFDLSSHPMTKFSTGEKSAHVGDDYFLESNDKVRFFFEEGAFNEAGELTKSKDKAINKIGHALHDKDEDFRRISTNDEIVSIARALEYGDPRVLQSMIICKQPEIGGAVPSHQDSVFLYTDKPSAVGFWFALEDCTRTNGCLSFAPGTHKSCAISKRFVRDPKGTGTTFVNVPGVQPYQEPSDDAFVVEECRAGSMVLIHGSVLHKSEANKSLKSRYIYTFHMIDVDSSRGQVYDEKNWLQPPAQGFTKLFA
ncbi:Putative uncharacterized protein [Taphrina deformans PYCC 5710]|uniref:Phytanoyl-CoA dioxygenase family protein n=1 Tax=Taphrina deformans (strain PYCC 5710 / ATCC 11124 / CBS 356.35 / IMI 108563 / JCM 9778 / NBRC 8474) TaxID=1097556 RepID=R4X968_TAPDE|nr:Putative uncharacterized protein [Taphrina deformans PYCC 5710]|eukprot:CCG80717.1 Putative uncharacterized protein [Taphrina deformans PYCC 5710]